MTKYKLLEIGRELDRLNKLNDIYSPDGAKMIVFRNGIFGGQMFYDHTNKKIYGLTLKEVPMTSEDEEWLDGVYAKSRLNELVTYKEAIEILRNKEAQT